MTIQKGDALATAWTFALTASAIAWLVWLERWVTRDFYSCSGAALPAPTEAVIDAVLGGPSLLLAFVPAALSSLAVGLRSRAPRAASVLVYFAPQIALFAALLATLALIMPAFGFIPDCRLPTRK